MPHLVGDSGVNQNRRECCGLDQQAPPLKAILLFITGFAALYLEGWNLKFTDNVYRGGALFFIGVALIVYSADIILDSSVIR